MIELIAIRKILMKRAAGGRRDGRLKSRALGLDLSMLRSGALSSIKLLLKKITCGMRNQVSVYAIPSS